MIDNVEFNNLEISELVKLFNQSFDGEVYENLKSSNQFFKLTHKKQFKETVDGKETFYKKLIKE